MAKCRKAMAKCRRAYKFLKHFWTFTRSPTRFHDTPLLTEVFEGYRNYAARVEVARNRLEYAQKKMEPGAKVAEGRTPYMSPDELAHCLDMINTVVGRNSSGAIMEAVRAAGIAMCQDVLLVDLTPSATRLTRTFSCLENTRRSGR